MAEESKNGFSAGLVPEFYFDIIARVIPGAIAIAVLLPSTVPIPQSVIGTLLCLMGAYTLGFAIEISGQLFDLISWSACLIWRWKVRKTKRGYECGRMWEEGMIWQRIQSFSESNRILGTKLMAERIFVRSLFILSVLAMFLPMQQSRWQQMLPQLSGWVSTIIESIAAAVFGIAYFAFQKRNYNFAFVRPPLDANLQQLQREAVASVECS